MALLRVWQHVRLRSSEISVGGVLLRVNEDGVVEDDSVITPEALRSLLGHPNWHQADYDSGAVGARRTARLRAVVAQRSLEADRAESSYRSALASLEAAKAQLASVADVTAEPEPEPSPKRRAVRVVASKYTDETLAILLNPASIVDDRELKAVAAAAGVKTVRRDRKAIEADMKALGKAELKEKGL